jgi:hypothetical protein
MNVDRSIARKPQSCFQTFHNANRLGRTLANLSRFFDSRRRANTE